MNLWLANPNYRFGTNAFLPYSAGRLWAYAKAQPDIAQKWTLGGIIWEREPFAQVIERMRAAPPDVLGLSLYVWSEQYCLGLAKAVKAEWPQCVIVGGGPQVPEKDTIDWAVDTPVNCAVVGEGEKALATILLTISAGATLLHTTEWKGWRADDLSAIPSPYLSGVFDDLVKTPGVQWQALQETNRGCPYQCTFCDWGSATYSKVRKFGVDTCIKELEWFAENKVELLYNCDANFGMLEQDEVFTDALIETSKRTGYPQKFRAAYAKKINDRVFRVSKKISDAGMSKGATISFQSMDEDVLKNVKRINPVQNSLAETMERYNAANIPTYTELIVGLPGETLESFKAGIDALLDAGQHYGLAVYPCMALRNSELSTAESRAKHGLKTVTVDLLLLHGEPGNDPAPEKYELVVETNTMPHADWRKAWEFGIVVQALHCSGLMTANARAMRGRGTKYSDLYGQVIEFKANRAVRNALDWWNRTLDKALAGGGWDTVLPEFGNVQWPPEEAIRLMISRDLGLVEGNPVEWAREVVWYGRKGGKLKEAA